MNKHLKSLAFCIIYYFLLTTTLTACALSPNYQDKIQIQKLAEISDQSANEVQQAANATKEFFEKNNGLILEKPVTIVLTPNRKSYITEVIARFHLNDLEAEKVARGTDALSSKNLIIVNMSALPTVRQKTFLIAHELTHHYQRQIAGNRADQIIWLLEGMAESVGAQVVDQQGYLKLDQYEHNWQGGLRMATSKPDLAELETRNSWSLALSKYGSPMTYKTAGLAVLILTQEFGQQKVLEYFRGLERGESPDVSFQNAFGISISTYQNQFMITLRKAS